MPPASLLKEDSTKPGAAIKRLIILCDASSIRNNPYLGKQLHSLILLLKASGVECQYLQDRMGLVEAAGIPHELFLESVRRPEQQETGNTITPDGKETFTIMAKSAQQRDEDPPDPSDPVQSYIDKVGKLHKGGQTYIKKNYQRFIETLESCVGVSFVDSSKYRQWLADETLLTRQHLFADERFGGWDKERDAIANGAILGQTDPYYVGLYHTCNTASHIINAINRKIRNEPEATIDPDVQAVLGLDKYPPWRDGQATHYLWTDIQLNEYAQDPNISIPLPIVKGFMQSAYTLDHIVGRRGKTILPAGKELHAHYADAGEDCMKERAIEILSARTPDNDSNVLLITDDGPAYKKLKGLSEQHPGHCETLCSMELSKEILRLYPRLQPVCPADTLATVAINAQRIASDPWGAKDERGNMLHLYDPPAADKIKFATRDAASIINTMLGVIDKSVA